MEKHTETRNQDWFDAWFDSPYYHILYQKRDDAEARKSLDALLSALHLPDGARILDLACGRGRHARYLAEKGFDVTGVDNALESIRHAAQFESDHLSFYQHDMRHAFRTNYYDATVNFFTSFGYFEQDKDHYRTLHNLSKGLKQGGLLLMDYFNTPDVLRHLTPREIKVVNGITFHLTRWADETHINKKIAFEADGKQHEFRERVRLFTLGDFDRMFQEAGLDITVTYGGYDLFPYKEEHASRLIMIAQKR